jgi:hypothetical protein
MRILTCLLIMLALWLAVPLASTPVGGSKVSAITIQTTTPQITGVRRKGKKLFVTGERFDIGAVILLDGEPQKTANDESNPTGSLIAKKAGKRIGATDVVTIEVQNANSEKSPYVRFFGGTTLTVADTGKSVALSLHEQFLVALDTNYEWSWSFSNPNAFFAVPVLLPLLGTQGIFRTEAMGTYTLTAKGEPFCAKQNPSCTLPAQLIEITLTVQ